MDWIVRRVLFQRKAWQCIMAHSKKTKHNYEPRNRAVGHNQIPNSRETNYSEDPDGFYRKSPSWKFCTTDLEYWTFSKEHVGEEFWDKILPSLRAWETQRWQQILIDDNKHNHPIDIYKLNKVARDRLNELHIDSESLISLRILATHRLYGYMEDSTFCALWFDDKHGDNESCVCRSYKK